MGLRVLRHTPEINATGVYRDQVVEIEFDQTLETSSVDYRVLSLHDPLYSTVPGEVGIAHTNAGTASGFVNKITFTPSVLLDSNVRYSVYVHKHPNSVTSINDDQLNDVYKFNFTTGSSTTEVGHAPSAYEQLLIDLQAAIDREDWEAAAEIQELLDIYGSGYIPSQTDPTISPDELTITSTYPQNEQPDVELVDLRHLRITFNDVPYASGIAFSDFVEVSYNNVLE